MPHDGAKERCPHVGFRPLLGRRGAAANFLEADIMRDVRGYISANPATVQSDVLQLPNGIGRSRHE